MTQSGGQAGGNPALQRGPDLILANPRHIASMAALSAADLSGWFTCASSDHARGRKRAAPNSCPAIVRP
jgi:hypothetical protein